MYLWLYMQQQYECFSYCYLVVVNRIIITKSSASNFKRITCCSDVCQRLLFAPVHVLHSIYCPLLQVEDIIREAHRERKKVRVVGNALSPNGIGLSEDTMMSLGQCNRVLHVDHERKTVTIEVIKNTQHPLTSIYRYCHLKSKSSISALASTVSRINDLVNTLFLPVPFSLHVVHWGRKGVMPPFAVTIAIRTQCALLMISSYRLIWIMVVLEYARFPRPEHACIRWLMHWHLMV